MKVGRAIRAVLGVLVCLFGVIALLKTHYLEGGLVLVLGVFWIVTSFWTGYWRVLRGGARSDD
jgi:uncharacterized membrane protein HdeD (DUF308 family)